MTHFPGRQRRAAPSPPNKGRRGNETPPPIPSSRGGGLRPPWSLHPPPPRVSGIPLRMAGRLRRLACSAFPSDDGDPAPEQPLPGPSYGRGHSTPGGGRGRRGARGGRGPARCGPPSGLAPLRHGVRWARGDGPPSPGPHGEKGGGGAALSGSQPCWPPEAWPPPGMLSSKTLRPRYPPELGTVVMRPAGSVFGPPGEVRAPS